MGPASPIPGPAIARNANNRKRRTGHPRNAPQKAGLVERGFKGLEPVGYKKAGGRNPAAGLDHPAKRAGCLESGTVAAALALAFGAAIDGPAILLQLVAEIADLFTDVGAELFGVF